MIRCTFSNSVSLPKLKIGSKGKNAYKQMKMYLRFTLGPVMPGAPMLPSTPLMPCERCSREMRTETELSLMHSVLTEIKQLTLAPVIPSSPF